MHSEPRVAVSVANPASAVFSFSLEVHLKAVRIIIMLLHNVRIASQDVVRLGLVLSCRPCKLL
jgi:hypothetical protein